MPKPIQPSKYGLVGLELPVTLYDCPSPGNLLEFYGDVGLALCPGLEGGQLAADGTPQDPIEIPAGKSKGLGPMRPLQPSFWSYCGPNNEQHLLVWACSFLCPSQRERERERERERAETSLNLTKIISE
jgi:hypothetical protein